MPQRGFEKVTNGDRGHAVLFAAGFETNEIRLGKLYLCGVFDQQDAFVRGNELSERVQKGRLAGSRPATNKQVAPLQDVVFKAIRECASERSAFDEARDFEVNNFPHACLATILFRSSATVRAPLGLLKPGGIPSRMSPGRCSRNRQAICD
jgi:hypothetical protein